MLINDLIKISKESFLASPRTGVNAANITNGTNNTSPQFSGQLSNIEKPLINRKINSIYAINACCYLKANPENDKLFSDLCSIDNNTESILLHLKKIFQQTSNSDFKEWSCRDLYIHGEMLHRDIPFEIAIKNNNIAVYKAIAEHLSIVNNKNVVANALAEYKSDCYMREIKAHCKALLVACLQNNLELIEYSKNFITNYAKIIPDICLFFITASIYKLNDVNSLNSITSIMLDIFHRYLNDIKKCDSYFKSRFINRIFNACNIWVTKQYWHMIKNILIFFKNTGIQLIATKDVKRTIFKLLANEKFDIVKDILNLFASKDDADYCFIASYKSCNNKKYYYTMLDIVSATLNAKIMTWIINTIQNNIIDLNDKKFFEINDNEILKKQYYPSCLDYAIINDNYTTGCVLLLFAAKSNIINYNLEYSSDIKEKITKFFFNPISLARVSAINLAKNFMFNEISLLEVKKAIAEFSPVIAKQILSINDIFSINSTDN